MINIKFKDLLKIKKRLSQKFLLFKALKSLEGDFQNPALAGQVAKKVF